ncbi:MAG: hypothetical protein ACOYMP_11300 [Nodosilinea sp.]
MVNRPADAPLPPWEVTGSPPEAISPWDDQQTTGGANLAPAAIDADPVQPSPNWRWLPIFLICSCGTSALALGAFFWLIRLPPTVDCDHAATLTSDRAELYCAQAAAESGHLEDTLNALDLVGAWSSSHPLYSEVQPLVERWSGVVLKAAQQQFQDNHLEAARSLIQRIPSSSPVYPSARAALERWNHQWSRAQAVLAKAQQALQQQDWTTAAAQVRALAALGNDAWQAQQVETLSRQIRREQQGQALLTQAVAMAATGDRHQLGKAMRRASQIHPSTFTHGRAQIYLDQWSDRLLSLGLQQWYASDLTQAITLARYVAPNPNRAEAAQQLIWLSQARQMAQQSLSSWRTSPDQLVKLYQAMMLANRISPDSPYYGQAQSSITTWHRHLGDLARLQTAEVAGRLGHIETLQLAIAQAQHIPLGHPTRVQAQTLIAHWRLTIERLQDRPYLVKAHQLARSKTIPNLQAAITTAQRIAIDRALRHEAQSWIYVWRNQIQGIEDRPLLVRSQQLASQGKLAQAITQAQAVAPGRALYGEAQAAIATWKGEIKRQQLARQRSSQAYRLATARPPTQARPSVPAAAPAMTPVGLRPSALPQVTETVAGPVPSPGSFFFEGKPQLLIPTLPAPDSPQGERAPIHSIPHGTATKAKASPRLPVVSTSPTPELVQPLR